MIIDIYKLIDSKLDGINVSDDKSIDYCDKIRDLNIQYLVYKLSLYEVSSLLGLEYAYDIKKINGGIILQTIDAELLNDYKVVTDRKTNQAIEIYYYINDNNQVLFKSYSDDRLVNSYF